MTSNNDDTQNEVSGITLKDSKNNGLTMKNDVEVITPNHAQTNSDDTNLTEQWKKGELEQGYYYMQIPTGDIRIITECMKVDCKGFSILSKVPSYEEYNRLKEVERKKGKLVNVNYKIKQENQQLKEKLEKAEATLLDIDGGWVTDEIRSKVSEYFVHAIGEKK